ncbi:MAG: hypothetical protein GF313_14960 [Caldithrix sp.]|nr:hypothetical protein [Caldithrix sp.]
MLSWKLIKVFLYNLLLPISLFAQFIDLNPVSLGNEQFPQAQIKSFTTGNLGFGTRVQIYNPKYLSSPKMFHIYLSFNHHIQSQRQYKVDNVSLKLARQRPSWAPHISAKIVSGNYNINLTYCKLLSFNRRFTGKYTYEFYSSKGILLLEFVDPEQQAMHHSLQIALSRKLSEAALITAGMRSNSFKLKTENQESIKFVEFLSPVISNLQYFLSVNYAKPHYEACILLRTQNAMNELKGNGFSEGYNLSFENKPFVSYPGLLG